VTENKAGHALKALGERGTIVFIDESRLSDGESHPLCTDEFAIKRVLCDRMSCATRAGSSSNR
jgi:hypothetical protein